MQPSKATFHAASAFLDRTKNASQDVNESLTSVAACPFCYANADLRKDQQNDGITAFVRFWKKRIGELPEELIRDAKLTTCANLNRLNRKGVQFITLRRRSPQLLQELLARPRSAWRRIELGGVSRQYKTPRILDATVTLDHNDGPLR